MSKRLQVVLDEEEFEEIRHAANRLDLTISDWVRRTLREARQKGPSRTIERKLEAIRRGSEHSFPVADIDQLLSEIERGYLADSESCSSSTPTCRFT
jgi:hypothetical protein